MTNIERRIEKAERFVGVKEEEPAVVILGLEFGEMVPHFPEPADEWLTFKKALEETRRLRQCALIFQANPWHEYEARHGLEPGTLANHELCGKVPFAELLAVATGRRPDQGEQPCIDCPDAFDSLKGSPGQMGASFRSRYRAIRDRL